MSRDPIHPDIDHLLVHAEWLRKLSRHVVLGEGAADLVQETWVAALRSPPDPERAPRPWLAAVFRNFARRRARDERARAAREADAAAVPAGVPSPEVLLERAEAQRILADLVVTLDEPYRTTVLLRYHEGLTAAAIASVQGIPAGTVRWRLKQAIRHLRQGLDERYSAGGRGAWAALLGPSLPYGSKALPWKGVFLMAGKSKAAGLIAVLAVLGAAVLGIGGWLVWHRQSPSHSSALGRPLSGRTDMQAAASSARSDYILAAWQKAGTAGSIAGTVVDADGRAIVGAQIALVVDGSYGAIEDKVSLRPRAALRSQAGGRFQFNDVAPGIYLLTATAPDCGPAQLKDLSLLAGARLQGLELRLGRGGVQLSGRILDGGGGTIGASSVRALALGPGGLPDGARTFLGSANADGSYEMRLQRGSYQVVADAEGYAPATARLVLDVDRVHDFRLAPAVRVSGRVVDKAGDGVPRAVVRIDADAVILRPSRAATTRETKSDESGAFTFEGVPSGSYQLSARAGRLVGRAPRKVLVAGVSASGLIVEVSRGLSVSGTVEDAAGHAIASAHVKVSGDAAAVTSGAGGAFQLDGLSPGRVVVSAEAPGHGSSQTTVVLEATDVKGTRLVLAAEARVEGRVLDREGQPLAGASVTALVATPDALADVVASSAVGVSDSAGHFLLTGLGPGELRLEAEHPEAGRAVAGPLPLQPGERRTVDLHMGSGGLVRGTVSWDDRSPAVGVVVTGTQRRGSSATTVTDAQGRYEVGPFSAGEVAVDARPETDALERGGSASEKRVSLAAGEDKDGVEIVLARRDQEISGVVLDPDGSPLAGATVGIAREYRGVSYRPYNKYAGEADGSDYSVLSDGAGAFTVKFMPQGKYDVWATHPEYPEADTYGVMTGERAARVQFARGASLGGRVVDGAGKPVATFTISVMLSEKNTSTAPLRAARGYVQSTGPVQDAGGAFEVTGLHAAIYDVLVIAPDGNGGRLSDVSLGVGEAKRGLRVVVGEGVRVTGVVIDEASGRPLPGITVVGWQAMLVSDVRSKTGADGRFRLEDVVPGGTLGLVIRGDGRSYGMKRQPVSVPAGQAEVDVGALGLPAVKSATTTVP